MAVKIRPARPSDKGQLMSFIKDIWGGHDYLPYVWDEWLEDPRGKMFVVEVDGVPVGMNRVKFLRDGSAWNEGVRVHPDYRGRGLASMLGENSMRVARGRGVKVFRLTSGSHNRQAHRQIARMKFAEKSRVSVYEPPKAREFHVQTGVRLVRGGELPSTEALIRNSVEFRLASGVYWDTFTATTLTPAVISEIIGEGGLWTTGNAIGVSRLGGEGGDRWNQVCFLTGGPEDAMKIVNHVFARRQGTSMRRLVYLPQKSSLIGLLRSEGFTRDFSMILFERLAANG